MRTHEFPEAVLLGQGHRRRKVEDMDDHAYFRFTGRDFRLRHRTRSDHQHPAQATHTLAYRMRVGGLEVGGCTPVMDNCQGAALDVLMESADDATLARLKDRLEADKYAQFNVESVVSTEECCGLFAALQGAAA